MTSVRAATRALLPLAVAACAAVPRAGVSQPGPASAAPRFWYEPTLPFVTPAPGTLLNENGSPRIADTTHYVRFMREHAAALREWAADPRLRINPGLAAALYAKESGFDPRATSHVPANGLAQITHIADADLQIITREAPAYRWMRDEVAGWPRSPIVHSPSARKATTDSLLAAGALSGRTEYLFDPRTSVRASLFWLRILADVWLLDEWPGQHAALARERLAAGGRLSERDLLELVLVSYNQGHPYVADLVTRHGRAWTRHLNEEAADYLERILHYTSLFQGAVDATRAGGT